MNPVAFAQNNLETHNARLQKGSGKCSKIRFGLVNCRQIRTIGLVVGNEIVDKLAA